MKNEISVQEVLDLKDDITMVEIMSLQDGMTKEDNDEEPIMGMKGIEEMAEQMEVIDIDGPSNDGVKFIEIFNEPEMMKPTRPTLNDDILESVMTDDFQATKIP